MNSYSFDRAPSTLRNSWKMNGILNNIKSDLRPDTIGFQECDSPELLESRTHLQAASKFEGAQGISVLPRFLVAFFETFSFGWWFQILFMFTPTWENDPI